MPLIIVNRPEKTLDNGYLSRWNASATPLNYKFSSDLFPINSVDPVKTTISASYDASLRGLKCNITAHSYSEGQYLSLNTTTSIELGVYKIKQVIDADNFVLDYYTSEFYTNDLEVQVYYKGYKALVKVYAGSPEYHTYNNDGSKPNEFIGTIEVDFDTNNEGICNVRNFVKPDMAAKWDEGNENSHFLWTSFFIEYAEIWDGNTEPTYEEDILENCLPFIGLSNDSFDNGLTDWTQEDSGIDWFGGVGNVTVTGVGQQTSKQLTQDIDLRANVEYNITIDYIATIQDVTDNFTIVTLVNYVGGSGFNATGYFPNVQDGGDVKTFKFIPNGDVESLAIAVFTNNPTPSNFVFQLNEYSITTDATDQCLYSSFAVLGAKQFQDNLGGNFGDYIASVETQGKLLTHFEKLHYPFYINSIIPASTFYSSEGGDSVFLEVVIYDQEGNQVEYIKQDIEAKDDGVYTIIPNITSNQCDWVSGTAQIISTPTNMFLDGDNGTFEDGTPANWNISELDSIAPPVIADTNNPRTGNYAGQLGLNYPTSINKGSYDLYKFDSPLNVQDGLVYIFNSWYYRDVNFANSLDKKAYIYFKLEGTSITSNKIFLDKDAVNNIFEYVPLDFSFTATQDTYNVLFCIDIIEDITSGGGGVFIIDDLTFEGPVALLSEKKDLTSNCDCGYEFKMRWLNNLGGWDTWNFTQWKTVNESVTNKIDIRRDVTQDFDDYFINGDTEYDAIKIEARKEILVRSQNLTKDQLYALNQIRTSIKPQALINDKWVTVSIDQGTFLLLDENDKTQEISFTIKLPNTIIQEQ